MKKVIVLIAMVVILGIGMLAAGLCPRVGIVAAEPKEIIEEVVFCGTDIFDADPYPMTEWRGPVAKKAPSFPNAHQLKLIGRLAEGIAKYKGGSWWECGREMVQQEEIEDRALFYAYEIVRAADEVSDHEENAKFTLNPWGLAGVIRNESQFDRCALGTHPRRTAYRLGLLKKQKRCISHTEEEVLAVVQNEDMNTYFKRSGFDLGTAQLLSRFYADPKDFKAMLSVRGSTTEAAYAMRRRGRIFGTKRPWLYWRGYHCQWYDDKISRWARQLGALRGEI